LPANDLAQAVILCEPAVVLMLTVIELFRDSVDFQFSPSQCTLPD
jgi:hypothetical protein